MFSNERLVEIEVPGRNEIALFVDASLVETDDHVERGRAVTGLLRVEASPQTYTGTVNVMLPVASAELGRVVAIPSTQFAPRR
jgi:hypothetical protein